MDLNTSVIFTFEGVDYMRADGAPLDLSQITYRGQSPVAYSNEAQTVSYLITVDGGREYTINQDSFGWSTNNYSYVSMGPTAPFLATTTAHWMMWTNFHNQTQPIEVLANNFTYNGDNWSAVWCKLALPAPQISASIETDFASGRTSTDNYLTQTTPTNVPGAAQYSAAINGGFFRNISGDPTSCSQLDGLLGPEPLLGRAAAIRLFSGGASVLALRLRSMLLPKTYPTGVRILPRVRSNYIRTG